MSPATATVVTAAAAAVVVSALTTSRLSALTRSRRRNREAISVRKTYGGPDSFEVLANNLKAAAKQVDSSAAEVEVALKGLMAA